jgi:predicted dehydrogenase
VEIRRKWKADPRKDGYKNSLPAKSHPYFRGAIDILRCDAIHAVDALRYYCGLSEVVSVVSSVRSLDTWYANSYNALVQFENDAVGVLLAHWRTGRRLFRCEFHAAGAVAFADADSDGAVWLDDNDEPALRSTCREAAGSDEKHIAQGFLAENRAFIDAVRKGQSPHNSLPDAVKTMRLADQIYRAAGIS